jgi:LuxR family maltose regulon positive regulatory protein
VAAAAHLAELHDHPLSQARVQIALGEPAAALAILQPLRDQMAERDWKDQLLIVTILLSASSYENGDVEKAIEYLHAALLMAEPGGILRPFLDEGSRIKPLLFKVAEDGVMPDTVNKLIMALTAEEERETALFETLTPREREVLQLVAAGLTNPAIAAELVVSVTTVKTHVRNIYAKLGVSGRHQAIIRARELRLV